MIRQDYNAAHIAVYANLVSRLYLLEKKRQQEETLKILAIFGHHPIISCSLENRYWTITVGRASITAPGMLSNVLRHFRELLCEGGYYG